MAATSVSLGFRDVNGRHAYGCVHMAKWLPRFRQLVRQELGVELEVVQALGTATASAGTHGPPGTALDLRSWRFTLMQITALVKLAREAGAPATWYRTPAQGFSPHIHLVLDCPCWSPADYQITAVKAGYNGLGKAGRGGKDDGPRPLRWRDYTEGMTWISTQLNTGTLPTAPAPGLPSVGVDNRTELERLVDSMDTADFKALMRQTLEEFSWSNVDERHEGIPASSFRNNIVHTTYATQATLALVRELAQRQGIDVDEAALARELAASVAPLIREAIVAAVVPGATPDEVAEAVVAKLGTALTPKGN